MFEKFLHRDKSAHIAEINASTMVRLSVSETSVATTLFNAYNSWTSNLGTAPLAKMNDSKESFNLCFSPYAFDNFCQFYRQLIIDNVTVPKKHATYQQIKAVLELSVNHFENDNSGNPQFTENEVINEYPDITIGPHFVSSLLLIDQLLFFHVDEDFFNAGNLQEGYEQLIAYAKLFKDTFTSEEPTDEANLPTLPTFEDFQAQKDSSVYIPALTTTDAKKDAQHNQKQVTDQLKKTTDKYDGALEKFAEESANAEDAHNQPDHNNQSSSLINKINAEYGQSEKQSKVESKPETESATPTRQNEPVSPNPSAPAVKPSSQPSSATTASSIERLPSASLTDRVKKLPLNERQQLAKELLGDLIVNGETDFGIDFKFQKFDVDDNLKAPKPLEEAIKDADFDSQAYMMYQINAFKKTANEFIENKSEVLMLAYQRSIIDMVTGAHKQLESTINNLREHYLDDQEIVNSSRQYFRTHYQSSLNKIEELKADETKKGLNALEKEYEAKKKQFLNKIDHAYGVRKDKLSNDINEQAVNLMNQAKDRRNQELDRTIQAKRTDTQKDLNNTLKNHAIEFKHKMAESSNALFSYFEQQLDTETAQWTKDLSHLMNRQIELNASQERLRTAQIEAGRATSSKERLAKYNSLVSEQEDQISDLQQKIQAERLKHNQALESVSQLREELTQTNQQLNTISASRDAEREAMSQQKNTQQVQQTITPAQSQSNSNDSFVHYSGSGDLVSASEKIAIERAAAVEAQNEQLKAENKKLKSTKKIKKGFWNK